MKKGSFSILKRTLCVLLCLITLCCFGCTDQETALRLEQQAAVDLNDEEAMLLLADHRVLLTSDMHYTYLQTWYGVTAEARLQAWVDAILYEHSLRPFDLIVSGSLGAQWRRLLSEGWRDHYQGVYGEIRISAAR